MNRISGVYKITNNITDDFYIGSSKNIKKRWIEHKHPSYQAHKPNSRLYQDMQKYGLDQFKFELLEETSEEQCKNREQWYIEKLKPSYNKYNAEGHNMERYNEYQREWYKNHRASKLKSSIKWQRANADRVKEARRAYFNRICIYNGETLTLGALKSRFQYAGIPNPTLEAKKYLIIK